MIVDSGPANNILFISTSPSDVARQLADRVRQRRLELNLTQEGLARRAGIPFPTYRRFEQTAEISLRGLLQIAFALNCLDEFGALFSRPQYRTLDDAVRAKENKRKRGHENL